MADKKISALNSATTPLAGTEVLPIVQGGNTVKVAVTDLTKGRTTLAAFLGVNNNSPADYVEVSGSGANGIRVSRTGALTQYITLSSGSTGPSIDGSSALGEVSIGVNASRKFVVNNAGNTINNFGNYVVGTAGKGIDFSANAHAAGMTSELLNDYEEGTWTPTAVSTGGAITSYTSAATYTKVGRLVYINGYVQITNPGTASGGLIIDAIPYVNGNAGVSGKGQQLALVRESENTGQTYLGFMLSNSTQLRISALTGGAISWVANDQYSFSLCYYTT